MNKLFTAFKNASPRDEKHTYLGPHAQPSDSPGVKGFPEHYLKVDAQYIIPTPEGTTRAIYMGKIGGKYEFEGYDGVFQLNEEGIKKVEIIE